MECVNVPNRNSVEITSLRTCCPHPHPTDVNQGNFPTMNIPAHLPLAIAVAIVVVHAIHCQGNVVPVRLLCRAGT